MEILKVEKPEDMADYVYLTLDYAYLAGEEDNYKEMTELLKKSIDGLICMKHQCVNSILDISEIEERYNNSGDFFFKNQCRKQHQGDQCEGEKLSHNHTSVNQL